MAEPKRVYKVIFQNQGKLYEVYAKGVSHGNLIGFVEIDGLIFGEKKSVVVDPAEEALEREFAGVQRTYVPLHAVVRIDEVTKRGSAKIVPLPEKLAAVPTLIYAPAKTP